MTQFAVEKTLDENTGLDCWLVVDTYNDVVVDRAFDRQYALEVAEYYEDAATESDGQPTELEEWMDFDPDC